MNEAPLRFISVKKMADDIGKCAKTVHRMAATDPDFPKFIVLGNMFHAAVHEWEAYKKLLLQRGMKTRPLANGMKIGCSPGRPRKEVRR